MNRFITRYSPMLISMIVLFLLHNPVAAQNFHQVKDINTSTDAYPFNNSGEWYNQHYAMLNGICYFTAKEGAAGNALWRSDGTTAGTYKLAAGDIYYIVATNGKIIFSNYSTTPGLWVSDGTVAGTHQVLTVVPAGLGSFTPANLIDVNGTVYFSIRGNNYNDQLWKTDGTEGGTVLVKDLYDADWTKAGSGISNLTAVEDKVYFTAMIPGQNYQFSNYLWTSDGTTANTYQITDEVVEVMQMVGGTSADGQTVVYFTGSYSYNRYGQRYLWVTNGHMGNAAIATGNNDVNIYQWNRILNVNNVLYFSGYANTQSYQTTNLYKYDIAAANGITPVKLLNTGMNEYGRYSLLNYFGNDANGQIFFTVYDAPTNKNQFWKTDGTSLGNTLLKDNLFAYNINPVGNEIYFYGSDSTGGGELWKSNGTAGGTVQIKDINPGVNSSSPSYITYSQGSSVFFSANDGQKGIELWKSNGTAAGTALVKDINTTTTSSSYPYSATVLDNQVFFGASDGRGGPNRLWKSDGSNSGTSITSQKMTPNYLYQSDYGVYKNAVYTSGTYNNTPGLIKTNGTEGGTVLIKDMKARYISQFTTSSNLLYFVAFNSITAVTELWRSDGTEAGTYIIKDDFTGYNYNLNFAAISNTLFFYKNYDNSLWKTDGTVAGTVLVKTFTSLAVSYSDYKNMTAYNSKVYFEGSDDGVTYGLWKSDGTLNGTKLVSSEVNGIQNFTLSGNSLYFTATNTIYGNELFKTDGTNAGTLLVKDIVPGNAGSNASNLTDVSGTLFLFAADNAYNTNLWKTSGTAESSEIVYPFGPVYLYGYRNNLVNANGMLYFVKSDESKLWQSDGTTAGTKAVVDNNLQNVTVSSYSGYGGKNLVAAGDQVFFSGTTINYGMEMYAGKVGTTLPVTLLKFSGKLVKEDGLLQWSTASEYNSSHFVLERSIDGRRFLPAATIQAVGNSNFTTHYSYTDSNLTKLGAPNIYYRLQQVDKNGRMVVSSIIMLSINNKLLITATPNPIDNNLNLTIIAASGTRAQVSVINEAGKLILNDRSKTINAGTSNISYPASSWAAGIYFVKITLTDGSSQIIKVLKK